MKQPVEISAEFTQQEAQVLLAELRARYGQVLNELWYGDQFRLVPEGLRHGAILSAMPVMAAQKRLLGALIHSLSAVKYSQ
ncbi:hypothetical protein [Pseudomonas psychrophila]|uniref:hypothetical protein n=1 Tax=Pseudomonas psychrophila TaxID=122355 RepID=UPI0002E45BA0|nr:hypothetical protein [Pseudomonas psychrophila]